MEKKTSMKSTHWILQPWSLLFLILIQFLVQFLTSIYLYTYVAHVETNVLIMQKQDFLESEKLIRRKRSSALPVTEDNKVSDTSRVCMSIYIILKIIFYIYIYFFYILDLARKRYIKRI